RAEARGSPEAERGPWTAEDGPWTAEDGPWTAEDGPWTAEDGPWTAEDGPLEPRTALWGRSWLAPGARPRMGTAVPARGKTLPVAAAVFQELLALRQKRQPRAL